MSLESINLGSILHLTSHIIHLIIAINEVHKGFTAKFYVIHTNLNYISNLQLGYRNFKSENWKKQETKLQLAKNQLKSFDRMVMLNISQQCKHMARHLPGK